MVVVGAPLAVVLRGGRRIGQRARGVEHRYHRATGARVVAVRIGHAVRVAGVGWRMAVDIPVQTLARPVEDAVERLARVGVGREHHQAGEPRRIGRTQHQVAVARQDAHVVGVLVERVLPAPRSDHAHQHLIERVHVWVAVVGLVRIVGRVVRIHGVRHRAPVDQVVARVIRLGRHRQGGGRARHAGDRVGRARRAGCDRLDLRFGLRVDGGVDLAELEQVLAVVAGGRMVVGRGRQPELRASASEPAQRDAAGGHRARQHDQRAVESHLDLQVRLRAAVIGVRPRLAGRVQRVGHRAAG